MRKVFGVPCNECPRQVLNGAPRSEAIVTPYLEGPVYELQCPVGHSSLILLTNPKHEILFQMAAYALLDGDYRDAILTFATSLEVFWYFALQCIFAGKGAIQSPSPKSRNLKRLFQEHWRQTFGTEPPALEQPDQRLRNAVAHDGLIPSRDEAFAFGNKVLDLIVPAMMKLRWELPDNSVGLASTAILEDGKKPLGNRALTGALQDATILHDNESLRCRRLEDYMSHLRKVDALFVSLENPNSSN